MPVVPMQNAETGASDHDSDLQATVPPRRITQPAEPSVTSLEPRKSRPQPHSRQLGSQHAHLRLRHLQKNTQNTTLGLTAASPPVHTQHHASFTLQSRPPKIHRRHQQTLAPGKRTDGHGGWLRQGWLECRHSPQAPAAAGNSLCGHSGRVPSSDVQKTMPCDRRCRL